MSCPSLDRESNAAGGKSASFHAAFPGTKELLPQAGRPASHRELLMSREPESRSSKLPEKVHQRLTKLLLNVTIQGSLGPVQVVISPEKIVSDLIKAAVEIYVKEGRRPLLLGTDPQSFELHYSQFSLESLNPREELIGLGSRNFFLCLKQLNNVNTGSNQATIGEKTSCLWLRFMKFLL